MLIILFSSPRLWRSLETDSSNVARSCVGLMLLCADYMATNLEEAGQEGVWQEGEEEEEEEEGEGLEEKEEGGEEVDDGERVKSKLEGKDKKRHDKGSKKKKKKKKKDEDIFSKLLRDGLTSHNWSIRFRTSKSSVWELFAHEVLQFSCSLSISFACKNKNNMMKRSHMH